MNKIGLHTGLRGMYKIEAVRPDGSKRLLADWFPNLITNHGLDMIGNVNGYLTYCSVGSGSTAPAVTDTAMTTFVGYTSNIVSFTRANSSSNPYFGTLTMTYRFAAGAATGNLSEVGIGAAGTGLSLFSHALILDAGGVPTTITVLSSEALDVTYQLQLYASTVDVTGNVTIAGTSYAYTMRAANVTGTSWALNNNGDSGGFGNLEVGAGTINAVTSSPTFTSNTNSDSTTYGSYGTGNYYIDTTYGFSLTAGNVAGGLNTFLLNGGQRYGSLGQFQMGLTPSIPKDGSHTLTLTFRHSWGHYP